jgi:hypothetical protein
MVSTPVGGSSNATACAATRAQPCMVRSRPRRVCKVLLQVNELLTLPGVSDDLVRDRSQGQAASAGSAAAGRATSERWIDGSATTTIDASGTTMNWAAHSRISVSPRRRDSWREWHAPRVRYAGGQTGTGNGQLQLCARPAPSSVPEPCGSPGGAGLPKRWSAHPAANAVTSSRGLCTPTLAKTTLRWSCTVYAAMNSASAICCGSTSAEDQLSNGTARRTTATASGRYEPERSWAWPSGASARCAHQAGDAGRGRGNRQGLVQIVRGLREGERVLVRGTDRVRAGQTLPS